MSFPDYETERLQLLTAVALLELASGSLLGVLRGEQYAVLLDALILAKETWRGLYLQTRRGLAAPTRTLATDPLASAADRCAELIIASAPEASRSLRATRKSSSPARRPSRASKSGRGAKEKRKGKAIAK